jgi:hypothetical protein
MSLLDKIINWWADRSYINVEDKPYNAVQELVSVYRNRVAELEGQILMKDQEISRLRDSLLTLKSLGVPPTPIRSQPQHFITTNALRAELEKRSKIEADNKKKGMS